MSADYGTDFRMSRLGAHALTSGRRFLPWSVIQLKPNLRNLCNPRILILVFSVSSVSLW